MRYVLTVMRRACDSLLQPELAEAISNLWNDPGVQATYARRGNSRLNL